MRTEDRVESIAGLDCPYRYLAMSALLLGMAYAFAIGVTWARQGRPVRYVFIPGLLSWTAYLLAHYCVTGRFIDAGHEDRNLHIPSGTVRRLITIPAVFIMVLAVPFGIITLHRVSVTGTFLATAQFLAGYVVAHLAMTDTPL